VRNPGTVRARTLASVQKTMQEQKNMTTHISGFVLLSRSNAGSTKSGRRLAAYAGVTLLATIAGLISLYFYGASLIDSVVSFLQP